MGLAGLGKAGGGLPLLRREPLRIYESNERAVPPPAWVATFVSFVSSRKSMALDRLSGPHDFPQTCNVCSHREPLMMASNATNERKKRIRLDDPNQSRGTIRFLRNFVAVDAPAPQPECEADPDTGPSNSPNLQSLHAGEAFGHATSPPSLPLACRPSSLVACGACGGSSHRR